MSHISVATQPAEVHRAGLRELEAVSATLAAAFQDDPVFAWCMPDAQRRDAALPGFFQLFAAAAFPGDQVYAAAGGAALWSPPGRLLVAEENAEEFGERLAQICREDMDRLGEFMEMIDARHPAGDFYYLHFAGVRPSHQGLGIGSALLREVLQRCDAEGLPAYLEATSKDNMRLYQRHGFTALEPFGPAGAPPLTPMWREPAA